LKYSARIKPLDALRARASEIVRELSSSREPLILTENGDARAVLQDVRSYEETRATLALLKILTLGTRQIEEGRVRPVEAVMSELQSALQEGALTGKISR
jgi:prevent-host-death family protein